MDEDEMLRRMTRLLEKGCTMLANHHDCGAPLFRCQGKVVCPVCSLAGSESAPEAKPSVRSAPDERGPDGPANSSGRRVAARAADTAEDNVSEDADLRLAQRRLCSSILRKLSSLTSGLEEEQDLDKLKKQMDCIEALLRVLMVLRAVQ
jgi:UPF0148 protein